jgi:iron complex outermembrane receptor protein
MTDTEKMKIVNLRLKPLVLALGVGLAAAAQSTWAAADNSAAASASSGPTPPNDQAAPAAQLPTITVPGLRPSAQGKSLSAYDLGVGKASTSSTAALLQNLPGVYVYNPGGVSGLPMVDGLGDDRLTVSVGGMNLESACPNHMNSPLSYIDPTDIAKVSVYTGVAPVSVGGDSLGGAVSVDPLAPRFASPGSVLKSGELGTYYRSNGDAAGANARVEIASDQFNVTYTGSEARSADYKAGADFKSSTSYSADGAGYGSIPSLPEDVVGSTFYKTFDQQLAVAAKGGSNLVELKIGTQDMPYQGFVNQYMDMLSNRSTQVSLRYTGEFDGADVDAEIDHQSVAHYMNFGADRQFVFANGVNGDDMGMPMRTASDTTGVKAKFAKALSDATVVRAGVDLKQYHLNDWWPPAPVVGGGVDESGGMGPGVYQNINNGERDVYGIFGEVEQKLTEQLTSVVGIRYEAVKESTGAITSAYCTSMADCGMPMYSIPDPYNSGQSRSDGNWDASAIFKYSPSLAENYDLGFSRNVRSPSLYELYAWSTPTMMAWMTTPMNNFVGDGNGYVGNPDLKPEVANKISFDADWHDAAGERWDVRVSPYYNDVQNYIGAQCDTAYAPMGNCLPGQFNILKYVNENARIYGADLSGRVGLGDLPALGELALSGVVSYVRGKDESTGDNLYNMMPLNARVTLTETAGAWTNALEAQFVHAKTDVSAVQSEFATPGYALFNLRSTWALGNFNLNFGIDNLFNKFYDLPLGGAYIGQGTTMSLAPALTSAVPGMGRDVYARLSVDF